MDFNRCIDSCYYHHRIQNGFIMTKKFPQDFIAHPPLAVLLAIASHHDCSFDFRNVV